MLRNVLRIMLAVGFGMGRWQDPELGKCEGHKIP